MADAGARIKGISEGEDFLFGGVEGFLAAEFHGAFSVGGNSV